ncbi:vascular endothelial growth factor receptor 1-like isoform X2 [Acipenser ruthenus]|uniref:vascular endothelial growth factor receptor 1-like isoform X2 n=1 Tax=Acipenser ruthenus TaxID=7906 RepID=UPI0027408010|nr:vascular endothelial growth factor receptor 1-like isoform X2 [Acipenser ruthenus]
MICYILIMCCGLAGNVLSKGSRSSSRLNSPVLSVTSKQLVIQASQTLQLQCKGKAQLAWTTPDRVHPDQGRLSIKEYRCGSQDKLYCSSLTLSGASARDTGAYACKYSTKMRKRQAAVYVYIRDALKPFLELHSNIPEVVYLTEGSKLIIPCRVTAPDIPVTLKKFPEERLIPDGKNLIWNSKHGFIIPDPTYQFIGLLSCEATSNGVLYSTKYLTHRQANTIFDVYLNATNPLKMLRGETLAINCTVTAEWNARVQITWDYPGKGNSSALITNRIDQSSSNIFHSVLVIKQLKDTDRGVYSCNVQSGPSTRDTNTTLVIYDKPFISVKYRHRPTVEVAAGQDSFRLSMKVKAFPSPEVVWLKDGMIAAEKCARYKIDGYTLIIRDVSEEDAGSYTLKLGIQQHNLYRNLTVSLVVNVKPQIGEKAVSYQDPGTYPVGSKQALICTSHGFPLPRIQWLWHPCARNNTKGLCKLPPSTKRTLLPVPPNYNHTGNRILSITERTEVFEGKNKTVGVLVLAEAQVSGVYRCLATNKVGKDRRNIHFIVTEVPNGFSIELERVPTEGEDLRLACKANRFLYTDLAWTMESGADSGASLALPNSREEVQGEYSDTVLLKMRNVSQEHSATYVCTARHGRTGKEVRLEKRIDIIAQEAPLLLRNLSAQQVNVSSSITLTCPAEGVPNPHITWYKDSLKLQQGSGIILAPGGNLTIERVKEEDEGVYKCEATNQKGSVESSAYIAVQAANQSGVLALAGRADSAEKSNMELIALSCSCVVATLFWLFLTLFIRKLKRPSSAEVKLDYLSIIMDPGEVPLDEQCERLPYDASKWEFPRDRLKLGKSLGRGAFGKVVQAAAFGIKKSSTCRTVAVKMLKEGATASEYKALMTELKILSHIGHHLNVVNLLGACTKYGGPLMVIVEYCKYGNLSNYLKSKRDVFVQHKDWALQTEPMKEDAPAAGAQKQRLASMTSSESLASSGFEEDKTLSDIGEEEEDADSFYNKAIAMEDLISYSFQVARGMEFLASRKCIHRDLAARNILLSENNVVKICDFGLARDIYKDPDYVRKGDARLPLKWMALESVFDKLYTTQSDVWSYGVLLWEIFSLGASPYPGVQIDEDFCRRLKEGTRMRAPEYATPEIYKTMLSCWESDPKERPTFSELVERLGDLLQANVQQDGKDYIPLNTLLTSSSPAACSSSSSSHCSVEEEAQDSDSTFSYECSGGFGYMNTRRAQEFNTFEEFSLRDRALPHDYQTDSGMVLASEEFKCLMWSRGKPRHSSSHSFGLKAASKRKEPVQSNTYISSCALREQDCGAASCSSSMQEPCCSPPPDYNAAVSFFPPL